VSYSVGPGPTRYEHQDLISRLDRVQEHLEEVNTHLTDRIEDLQGKVQWLIAVAGLGVAVITFLASVLIYHIEHG